MLLGGKGEDCLQGGAGDDVLDSGEGDDTILFGRGDGQDRLVGGDETIGGVSVLTNPMLIAEVLSPSTEAFDRGEKFTYYQSILSFCEYLLLAQNRPHIAHYVKDANGRWLYEEVIGMDASLRIVTLDCTLPLSRIYRKVNFATAERSTYPRAIE